MHSALSAPDHPQLERDLRIAAQITATFKFNYLNVPALNAGSCVILTLLIAQTLHPGIQLSLPGVLLELARRSSLILSEHPPVKIGPGHSQMEHTVQSLCLQALSRTVTGSDLQRLQRHGSLRALLKKQMEDAGKLTGNHWLSGAALSIPDEMGDRWIAAPVLELNPPGWKQQRVNPAEADITPGWAEVLCPSGPCAADHARLALKLLSGDPGMLAEARQRQMSGLWKAQTNVTSPFPTWIHHALFTSEQWPQSSPHRSP